MENRWKIDENSRSVFAFFGHSSHFFCNRATLTKHRYLRYFKHFLFFQCFTFFVKTDPPKEQKSRFSQRSFFHPKISDFGSQNGPKMEAGGVPEPQKMGLQRRQGEKNIFSKDIDFWERSGKQKRAHFDDIRRGPPRRPPTPCPVHGRNPHTPAPTKREPFAAAFGKTFNYFVVGIRIKNIWPDRIQKSE